MTFPSASSRQVLEQLDNDTEALRKLEVTRAPREERLIEGLRQQAQRAQREGLETVDLTLDLEDRDFAMLAERVALIEQQAAKAPEVVELCQQRRRLLENLVELPQLRLLHLPQQVNRV